MNVYKIEVTSLADGTPTLLGYINAESFVDVAERVEFNRGQTNIYSITLVGTLVA